MARIKVGASALVVIASVVNGATANCTEAQNTCPAELSWAVHGGARSVRDTRALLARKAASTIRFLDLLRGAQAVHTGQSIALARSPLPLRSMAFFTDRQFCLACIAVESSHQNSAP